MTDIITPYQVAKICHEANRAYCESLGDMTQMPWDVAPEWQKTSAYNGVIFVLTHQAAGPDANHKNWYDEKLKDGWKYGPVKDASLKEHPCMVDYKDLPAEQKAKDELFRAVVMSLRTVIAMVAADEQTKEN